MLVSRLRRDQVLNLLDSPNQMAQKKLSSDAAAELLDLIEELDKVMNEDKLPSSHLLTIIVPVILSYVILNYFISQSLKFSL